MVDRNEASQVREGNKEKNSRNTMSFFVAFREGFDTMKSGKVRKG
jgi:hypothetical protein